MNVEKKVKELERRIEELERNPEEVNTDQSLEDFVEKVNPDNYHQCTAAIGYYFDVENNEKFSWGDISKGLLECRWSKHSNMSMLKNQLLNKKEWIREYAENEEGETIYILTKDGKEFVEGKLNE